MIVTKTKMLDGDLSEHKKINPGEGFNRKKELNMILKVKHSIKQTIFTLIMKSFPMSEINSDSNNYNYISMYLLTILETFQVMSLLWFPKEDTYGWQKFKKFWAVLSYPRVDNFCSFFGVIPTCFYVSVGISLSFLAIILGTLFCYFWANKQYNKSYSAIRKLFLLICTILYIPMLTIQLVILKNIYIGSSSNLIQYDIKLESLNKPFIYLGMLSIIFLYFSVYIYNALIFECRHTFSSSSLYSRAHSRLEIGKVHFHFFSILGYAFFADSHQQIFRCLVGITSGYLSYSYFIYSPFYSNHTNTAKVVEYSAIACLAWIFIFSYLSDNAFHSFVLSVLALPPFLCLIIYKTYESFSKPKHDVLFADNVYSFELSLRAQLTSPEDDARVIRYFSEAYDKSRFGKDQAMILWLTNFCYFQMEDENLARIKLGTETIDNNSIDIEFKIFCRKQFFLLLAADHHEDINFLKFRTKFDKIKKDDEFLCVALMEFLRSIQSGVESASALNDLVPKISNLFISITEQYEDLISSYPKSSIALNLYGTFLENILNQNDKAADILRKMENIKMKNEVSNILTISYFDERNGLLIISGAFESFSIISYVNETVGKILKQPSNTIIGNSISSYIPYPFNINHNYHMKKYILCCETADIPLPLGLFLQNDSGFLIECFVQVKCTALEKNPFFIVIMRERRSNREIAILKNNGLILNHSEKFSSLIGAKAKFIKDRFIDEFIEGYSFQTMTENFPYIIKKNGNNIGLVRSFKIIKKKKVDIFYLIKDPQEIIGWRRGIYSKEVKYSADQKLDVVNTVEEIEPIVVNLKKNDEKVQVLCPRSNTENKGNDSGKGGSKHLRTQQIFSPSMAPQRTVASLSTLNTNNLSSNPKFGNAFWLLTRMKWIVMLCIIITITIQCSSSLVISSKYSDNEFNEILDVGYIAMTISQIPSITRTLQLGQADPLPETTPALKLLELQSNLSISIAKYKSIYKNTKCDSTHLFPDIQEYNPITSTTSQDSILNIILNLKHSLDLIDSETQTKSRDYAIINSLLLSQELFKSNDRLVECKKKIGIENENIGIYLLIACITFSGISFLFIVAAWFKLRALYKEIWNIFYKHANIHLSELCSRVTNRLIDIHRKVEYKNFENGNLKISMNTFRFFSIFQYFWRLSLYVCVLFSFFFILFYYSVPNLKRITDLHPNALMRSYDADIYIYLLKFWVREKVLNGKIFIDQGNFYLFKGVDENIEDIAENLKQIQNFFQSDKFLNLIKSESTFETLHKSSQNSLGQYSLLNDLIMHSYIMHSNSSASTINSFKSKTEDYTSKMSFFISNLCEVFKSSHTIQNQSILTYTLLYLLTELLLFSFIFLSILSGDISKIKSFKKLGEFIPIKLTNPLN